MDAVLQDPAVILVVSLVVVVASIVFLRIGAFLSLLLGALIVSFWTLPSVEGTCDWVEGVARVGAALGTTAGKIGILIVFGTIIGKCMTDGGSADRIILACRRLFGEKNVPAALAGGAFILSIPVFYDATFYLLLPLAKSVYRSIRKNYVTYLLAVGLGATISHTMIPPTPGPIAVAQTLGVSISTSLGIGALVGICLFPFALGLAKLLNKRLPNPRISPTVLEELEMSDERVDALNESQTSSDESSTPPLWLALAPIVAPAVLIAAASIVKAIAGDRSSWPYQALFLLGDSNVALGLAALCAGTTLVCSKKRRTTRSQLEEKLNAAIMSAGTIILITAAGGAYGAMLRESGIGDRIQELFSASGGISGAAALTLAFVSTALLKSAQGSSTTAMITSASIFASIEFTSENLGFNLGYMAAAIGAGSSVASWMNDSGFCLFSRSSGVSELDCLRVWTVGTGALGICGFIIVMFLSRILPFV